MDKLNRSLNLPLLVFYGTGMILGAGIYSIIGKAAATAQDTLWIGFILAAIAAFFTALSYAELATLFPKTGAEYIYLKNALPKFKWISISTGLLMAFSGAATAATVAVAFSGYLNSFMPIPLAAVSIGILILFSIVNIIGIQQSSWINAIFTIIEIVGLIIFIYLGWQSPEFGKVLSAKPNMGTLASSALIIFAYFGFENIVSLVEETKKPETNVPRAIIISLSVATLLYILVAFAALALMSPDELASSNAVLTDAAKQSSPKTASVLGAIALFATANTALIALVTTSRILYGMAVDRALPALLAKVLPKSKTPWVAALVVLGAALILVPLGEVEVLAGVSSLATMISFIAINLALIFLRYSHPNSKRPFKVPLSIRTMPILPLLGIIICLVFLFQFEQIVYQVGIPVLIVVLIVGFLMRKAV